MAKIKIIEGNYNEALITEKCFTFNPDIRSFLYRYLYANPKTIFVLKLITKYLLKVKKNIKPFRCNKLLIRWVLVTIYYFFKEKYNYDVTIPEFENIINKGFTVEHLSSMVVTSNELFGNLFNAEIENNKQFGSDVKALVQHLSSYSPKKPSYNENYEITPAKVNTLLTKGNYFFSFKGPYHFYNEFSKFSSNSSIDRIIADINSSDDLVSFKIRMNEKEFDDLISNYKITYNSKGEEKTIGGKKLTDTLPILFGYMIYHQIRNNDLKLKKTIKFLDPDLLLLHLGQLSCLVDSKSFIHKDSDYFIILENINSVQFEFEVNNISKHYIFSSDGLKEV